MRTIPCVLRRVVLLAGILVHAGCSGGLVTDTTVPREPLDNVYWSLSVNYRAVNLAMVAPYDTVYLTAVPRNAAGAVLEGTYAPVFTVLDTARLSVDSSGRVKARAVGSNIKVSVSLQIGTVTHTDTTLVKVTANKPANPLATLSIQPAPTDSTRWSWGGDNKTIRPTVLDTQNRNLASLQIAYTSSNPRIATINVPSGTTNGSLTGRASGRTWISASTYAYGVYRMDSVEYTIGLPVRQIVDVIRVIGIDGKDSVVFAPSSATIAVGGNIWFRVLQNGWTLQTGTPAILFDTPEHVKASPVSISILPCIDMEPGNIEANRMNEDCPGGGLIYRLFDTPGEYVYRDGEGRSSGKIIVGTNTP